MKKYRQELICWDCGHQYSFPIPEKIEGSYITQCPYCGVEAVVDLSEIPEFIEVQRDGKERVLSEQLQWPELMQTKPKS